MTTDEPAVSPATVGGGLSDSAALGEREAPGAVGPLEVAFTVRGRPAAQGSKRHVGKGRMIESSPLVGPWRDAVRLTCAGKLLELGVTGCPYPIEALFVGLTFRFPRPAVHYGQGRHRYIVKRGAPPWPRSRPDIDKLARSTLDGLVEGGVMRDDGQVAELHALKTYSAEGFRGCLIVVRRLPGG